MRTSSFLDRAASKNANSVLWRGMFTTRAKQRSKVNRYLRGHVLAPVHCCSDVIFLLFVLHKGRMVNDNLPMPLKVLLSITEFKTSASLLKKKLRPGPSIHSFSAFLYT